ncbi:hypothetical protein A3Q56_02768 [Intoshia linei]|uniref:Uncharacterized protein n=1 Tax=Intoshia linei TaxID=1819745 RepID=A0A177B593_9BILA|nr:hypothetical protein A3Q56_02768 [Intoshia linei]
MYEILCPNAINANINYEFVSWLNSNYDGKIDIPKGKNWYRDDYTELEKLCNAYKILKNSGKKVKIKWKKLPNARWNIRANLALMAYILNFRNIGLEEC